MIRAISGRNKIGFLDGSCPRPFDDSPTLQQWERVNDIVTSWILNSMSMEISDSVVYADTAEEVWSEIDERYGKVNGVRIFELKKELASISQGSLNIAAYFNKIKTLWDELGLINKSYSINCTCGAKKAFHKFEEEQRLYQFLMGLNETYVGVRSNILLMSPLPSVGNAYNMLLSDEKQRQMQPGFQFSSDSASFIASNNFNPRQQQQAFKSSQNNSNFRPNNQYNNSNDRNNNYPRNDKRSYSHRNNGDQRKPYFCKYCKITGHIEFCRKRPSYSPDQVPSRNMKNAANATSQHNEHPGSSAGYLTQADPSDRSSLGPQYHSESSHSMPTLTKEQYNHLVSLLQLSYIYDNTNHHEAVGSANFAGNCYDS